ncbi:hypothetical protein [Nocardia asiatica]
MPIPERRPHLLENSTLYEMHWSGGDLADNDNIGIRCDDRLRLIVDGDIPGPDVGKIDSGLRTCDGRRAGGTRGHSVGSHPATHIPDIDVATEPALTNPDTCSTRADFADSERGRFDASQIDTCRHADNARGRAQRFEQ